MLRFTFLQTQSCFSLKDITRISRLVLAATSINGFLTHVPSFERQLPSYANNMAMYCKDSFRSGQLLHFHTMGFKTLDNSNPLQSWQGFGRHGQKSLLDIFHVSFLVQIS